MRFTTFITVHVLRKKSCVSTKNSMSDYWFTEKFLNRGYMKR